MKAKQLLFLLLILPVVLFAADVDVTENITSDVTWTANNIYILKARIYVVDGAKLTIEPGTVIKAETGTGAALKALYVTPGSQLIAAGTKENPIIFTSVNDFDVNDPNDLPWDVTGEWGGIVIMGKAPVNATGGISTFEAIPEGDPDEYKNFGGDDPEDSSGILEYVSIRHGGAEWATDEELNGLSLAGVGRGTTINHVEVFASSDDGFEWWGGTVNGDHLMAGFCSDESFDLDEGNQSKLQFLFAIRNGVNQHIGEHDGAPKSTPGNEPLAYTQVYNATYLSGGPDGDADKSMFRLRENWGGYYKNCIFGEYNGSAVVIDDKTTPDSKGRLEAGELELTNNVWFNFSAGTDWLSLGDSIQFVADYLGSAAAANVVADPKLMSIDRVPGDDVALDPRPNTTSVAYENLAAYPEADDFFVPVSYKGAFGDENWAAEWSAVAHYGFFDGDVLTKVEDKVASVPAAFQLEQNYPNPFNPTTTIEFSVANEGNVKLTVYNQLGQLVATLVDNVHAAGVYNISWNAMVMPTGWYYYRLEANDNVSVKKMMLIK